MKVNSSALKLLKKKKVNFDTASLPALRTCNSNPKLKQIKKGERE